jgi:hypothetical protein
MNRPQYARESTVDFSRRTAQRGGPSFTELFGEFNRLNLMLMERVNQAVLDTLEPAVSRLQTRRPAPSHKGADCADPCKQDDCHCQCCIYDADLVVYARQGERRVVPIVIENQRRRERQVRLELSDFTSSGGRKSSVKGVLSDKEFTLAACSEKSVVLLLEANAFEPGAAGGKDTRGQNDVDECVVLYADLRIEGCDTRPLRLALAFLPRDCAPFEVDCGCGCCD